MRHRNGVKKRCRCGPRVWPKCAHEWQFDYKPRGGTRWRFSLDAELGRHVDSRTEAEEQATRIRAAINEGTFIRVAERRQQAPAALATAPITSDVLTFSAFAEIWKERRGKQLVRPRDNEYRLTNICAFTAPGREVTLGALPITEIRTGDIEAFRDARKADGLSACTVNHDLKLLRKMFNWSIRRGYMERTPFKIGTEPAIALDREVPREWRFENDEDEQKLLDACDPHLRAVVVALLDTACRLGEILSLQWRNVSLERKEITIEALKAKTRTSRIIPISSRLLSTLEMRQLDPAGRELSGEAYVFGDGLGARVTSVRIAWEQARETAGFPNLQLRDLRHEAGSRFDEAGVPTNYVSKILGHTNLSTTTRYLNIQRRGLHLAMEKLEESQRLARERRAAEEEQRRAQAEPVARSCHTTDVEAPASVSDFADSSSPKRLPS